MKKIATLGLVVCLACSGASGQTRKSRSTSSASNAKRAPVDNDDRYSFRDAEIRLIQDYYRPGGGHPTPGQTEQGKLPAGLERQIKRKGPLPEGLEKHLSGLAEELARQLPPPTEGCKRAIAGSTVVLVGTDGMVHDLFGVGR